MRALIVLALLLTAPSLPPVIALDTMESAAGWQAKASDGVAARASSVAGHDGTALRLDWDFSHVAGYAYLRRDLPLTLPDNYAISVWVRWTGGVNNLEFKLVDASGDNVWWVSRPDIALKPGWQKLTFRKRDITFAWGPTNDTVLRRAASVEVVVSRGRDGGKGSLDLDQLELTALPAVAPILPSPKLSADTGDAALAMDGRRETAWSGGKQLTVDFGGLRALGGLIVRWARTPAANYIVQTSANGDDWEAGATVDGAQGPIDAIRLPETEARFVRIELSQPHAIAEIEIEPLAWGATPDAMISALAKAAPRGAYPRGFTEQSYWTLLGTDGGAASGLIGEDGAVELGKGGISVEPAVMIGTTRFDWAHVSARQSLRDGYLPIPSVMWAGPGWRLVTTAFADANHGKPRLLARYTLTNTGKTPLKPELLLGVRPFQVNPPAQFLSQRGGVSPIAALGWDGVTLTAHSTAAADHDRITQIRPTDLPARAAPRPFAADEAAWSERTGAEPARVRDTAGLASATLAYPLALAPGQSRSIGFGAAFDGTTEPVSLAQIDAAERATAAYWRDRLDRVAIAVPRAKQQLADTLRTSLAHILMSRDGPMLRPGTRSYARAWIRDGAMISEGLLRLGQPEIVAGFVDWYTPYLFPSGKVPCCVDFKGADPVPENDSHGEYIFLATELYRYTGDRDGLSRHWPAIRAAQRYMEAQRAETRTPETPVRLRGLMPPSISHEGYSAKPQYSLWDDFWALRGYKDAAYAADLLDSSEAREMAVGRDAFQTDLHHAIAASATHWKIGYIPGATSLGDFDATSTTIGLDIAGEQARLDPVLLSGTFDRYWRDFVARQRGAKAWKDYTPYELRNISAMIRLGHRERVDPMLDFFFADRRPQAWNGWAEVVGRDARELRFIGDMPHAWISSDFIRAALDMFAYERHDDRTLVLGAGLSDAYLGGAGSAIRALRTPYGTLDLNFRATQHRLFVTVSGTARPPGGFVVPWPWKTPPRRALVDGAPAPFTGHALAIRATGKPIRIEVIR